MNSPSVDDASSTPPEPVAYSIAVRELCEFAAKAGDLDHRFTPSPSALEGIAGHQVVASRRGESWRAEVSVAGQHGPLRVRGRVDGLDESQGLLEEVKTYRGDLARMPANHRALHWAQAKVYGALLCRQREWTQLKVSLVYFEIGRQEETALVESFEAIELDRFFCALCDSFLTWAGQELEHRRLRNAALATLDFPYDAFRCGQRQLAENVFRAVRRGQDLLAQAPTGIGKTTATLFPMLKACATEGLDKVFYLTAKNSGQRLAHEAIALLRARNPGLPVRVLELVARDSSCEHPDKACHGDSCPLARGFYDRLPAARTLAISRGRFDREALRQVAREEVVCPYYLTQELARWCDVAIGDYNYFFDSTALLHLLTLANQWKVGVLVDEAHNLLERARSMYSAELRQLDFETALRIAPSSLRPAMTRLHRSWIALGASQSDEYQVLADIPSRFESSLIEATTAITAHLTDAPTDLEPPLMRFYFDALQFQRRAQSFGPHSMFDLSIAAESDAQGLRQVDACIRNIVPATFLRSRYAAAHATVLFSATLSPMQFYADLLGLESTAAWLDVDAPFRSEQLDVHLVTSISTRWQHRGDSLAPIAELMASQYASRPGNYLAFFSSFDYMERAAAALALSHPHLPQWRQTRRMGVDARSTFLERFSHEGRGIGFAVLGGAFGEGIDLPGDRLIGAFIATLGLPQVNPVNQEVSSRLESQFGAGYDYTYLFPGLRKVVQAAGRVIRTQSDRGSVHLIDARFARADVQALLPTWWRPQPFRSAGSSTDLRPNTVS